MTTLATLPATSARDAPLLCGSVLILLLARTSGTDLASPAATVTACLAILLFGLPHGAFDLEILKTRGRAESVRSGSRRSGSRRAAGVLVLYVALAAAMYLLWQAAPVAALAIFLIVAAVHFSEDWDDAGSAFFAQGLSAALLTAPAFLHIAHMRSLFVALTGQAHAAVLADIMLLLAPVSLAVSTVALLSHWRSGRADRAATGAAVLAGMLLLPPAIGFAAFFCLYHSPRHFRAALAGLSADQFRRRWRFVAPLTLAALGIAAALFAGEARGELSAQVAAASFMTLSILTIPHMAVPAILARWSACRASTPATPKEPSHADQGPSRIKA